MDSQQIAVRVPEELLESLDELVVAGVVDSRADGMRRGLERLVDDERRRSIGAAIVAGYEAMPPDEEFDAWAEASGRDLIVEEPW